MKAYLLVFDSSQMTRDEVIQKIDRMQPAANWYAFFENTICVASETDAKALSNRLHEDLPKLRFLLTEVDPHSKGGWLPESIWDFLNNPAAPADSRTNA